MFTLWRSVSDPSLKKAWGWRCIKTANLHFFLSQFDFTSFFGQYSYTNWDKKSLSWVGQHCKPAARIVGQHWRSKFVVQNSTQSALHLHWVRFLPDNRERVMFCDLYWNTLIQNPKYWWIITTHISIVNCTLLSSKYVGATKMLLHFIL